MMPWAIFNQTNPLDRIMLLVALALAFLSSYFLFKPTEFNLVSPVFIGEVETEGSVQRRPSRSLSWQTINGGSSIYLKDYVYTPKDTRAKVIFSNKSFIELEPDSLIQFDEILQDQIQISLLDSERKKKEDFFSWLPSLAQKLTKRLRAVSPLEELRESYENEFKASLANLDSLSRVTNNVNQEIPTQLLQDFDLNLLYPKDERYNVLSNRWLEVEWTEIPLQGVSYQIDVSQTNDFRKKITYQTKKSKIKIQINDPGHYYWRVVAKQNEEKLESTVGHFAMTSRGGKTLLKYRLPKINFGGQK